MNINRAVWEPACIEASYFAFSKHFEEKIIINLYRESRFKAYFLNLDSLFAWEKLPVGNLMKKGKRFTKSH